MTDIQIIIAAVGAYLFGSISSAIIVCKLLRLPDPRTTGSRNPGATNVLRLAGKEAALITLLGDLLKGFIPVILAKWYGCDALGLSLILFSAFIGHIYPIFFRFQGGKGVATALGCMLALCWPVAIAWVATWLLVALTTRYSSLAALSASFLTPLYFLYFTQNWLYVATFALITLILIVRHKENISRLAAGTESKIGKKSKRR